MDFTILQFLLRFNDTNSIFTDGMEDKDSNCYCLADDILTLLNVAGYLNTVDFMKFLRLNSSTFDEIRKIWPMWSKLYRNDANQICISNISPAESYFHLNMASLSDLSNLITQISNSSIIIHPLKYVCIN